MLVPAMNKHEIKAEITKDLLRLEDATMPRLFEEYIRERKKLKISKDKSFPKCYPIRTASKNTWLLFLHKTPAKATFKGPESISFFSIVYFFSKEGLKVFRDNGDFMEEFYGHFFTRYNERLGLNLPNHVEIIKRFFSNSGYVNIKRINKRNRVVTISVCKDGMGFGEFFEHQRWCVHKTFINHAIKNGKQAKAEQMMMEVVERDVARKKIAMELDLDLAVGDHFDRSVQFLTQIHQSA